jgi:hypothetical protein
MAQDSIVGGLFGLTPEMYQRSQQAADQQEAMQFAQLSPLQQASAGFYSAGRGLGRGIGTLLGAEDPQLQMIAQQQQILRNVDPSDPESIAQGARMASEMGNPRLAAALSKQASDIALNRASIAQKLRERQALDPIQKLVESGKYSPESIAAYRESGNLADLRLVEKPQRDVVEQLVISGKYTPESVAKYQESKNIQDLIPLQKKTVGQEIGEGMAKGFGLLGQALAPALKKEGEETGKFSAKNYDELGGAVAAGISSKRNLDTLNSALKTAFTGTLSDTKTSIVKALDGVGLPVGDDLKKAASSTELLNAMSTRYVFPLVKNFPGSLAAKELDRLEKTAPTALQQPETIARLVNLLRTDISENEYTYNKAKEYRSQKGSLVGFNQADQKIEFQNKFNRLQSLYDNVKSRGGRGTKEEGEEINSLKRELGVK